MSRGEGVRELVCNTGSVRMRMGYLVMSEELYLRAQARLSVPAHSFCPGDSPEPAVLRHPRGPLRALKHGHAGDGRAAFAPGREEGAAGPVPARSGEEKAGTARTTGQSPAAAAGSAGGRVQEERSAPVPSAALPPARLRGAGTDGPGPSQVLQKLQ